MKLAALLMTFTPWIVLATLKTLTLVDGAVSELAVSTFPLAWAVISPAAIGASIFVAYHEGRLSRK